MEKLLKAVESFTPKYTFNFQFWGEGNNNVYISKDDVELFDSGGYLTIEEVIVCALQYIYKINRTPEKDRVC